MTIVFGWNTYLLKSVTPYELGLKVTDQPDMRIEYRQKYFHIFYIPFFPIGRTWAVRQSGKLYQTSPELQQIVSDIKPNWKHGLWAWSGPLTGIIVWIFVSISNSMEERASQNRVENNKAMLTAFFQDKNKTTPLHNKLNTMNSMIDSSLSKVTYEDKAIDTSMNKLLMLYLDINMTQKDSLTGYNQTNTYVVSYFPSTNNLKEIINEDSKAALDAGNWKEYSDTGSVFSELRKLEQYKYILVLKEYNRVEPLLEKDSYISGYSLVKGRLLSIETGKELANFNVMAANSKKVSHYSYSGSSSSSSQLRSALKFDLEKNVLKEAYKYVFKMDSSYY